MYVCHYLENVNPELVSGHKWSALGGAILLATNLLGQPLVGSPRLKGPADVQVNHALSTVFLLLAS